jgi:hypothetical protein
MKIFICTNENQLIVAKVAKNSIIRRSKYSENDIEIIQASEVNKLSYFFSKPYLRQRRMIEFDKNDMQSFTLLRFYIPELMNFQGRALVLDPDIFLVQKGIEQLESFSFDSISIYARRALQKNSWGSSVMLLSCEKLKHWSLESFIQKLHQGEIDYDDLINLRLENSISPLQTKWNEFDNLRPDTILVHLTERLTQPWRAGLKLNSTIEPLFKYFPRAPIYKIIGKDLTIGKEHPFNKVSDFFFEELLICINNKIISEQEINNAIDNKYIRPDIFKKLQLYED